MMPISFCTFTTSYSQSLREKNSPIVGENTNRALKVPITLKAQDALQTAQKMAGDRGLLEKVHILAGITPFKSAGMARYMKNRVPGMDVPDELVKRMADTPKEEQPEEGIKICIESIERLKEIKGVRGFHIMAIEWEERVPEIVEKSGLYPRPQTEDSD